MRAMLIIVAAAMSLLGFGASQAWAAPANDSFAAAHQLSSASGDVASTNQGATAETGEPNHAGVVGGSSVWFRWTADRTGGLTILTRQISFDTVLAVYTGPSV